MIATPGNNPPVSPTTDPAYIAWQNALNSGGTKITDYNQYLTTLKKYYDEDIASGKTKLNWDAYVSSYGSQLGKMNGPATGGPIDYIKDFPSNIFTNTPNTPFPTKNDNSEKNRELDDIFSNNSMVGDQTETPSSTPKSFLDYLGQNPMLGMSVSLEDRFRIAGESVKFDPSFLNDPKMEGKAKRANLLTGIAAGTSGLLGVARAFGSGMGLQKRNNEVMGEYFKDARNLEEGPYKYVDRSTRVFRDGGSMFDIPFEQMMIGETIGGLVPAMEDMSNAEVEADEYLLTKEGVKKVFGKTHEKDGEKIIMQPTDVVVSDNLKLGPRTAKDLAQRYGIKFSHTDTYAAAIDRFSDNTGLTEMTEELEGYFKKLQGLEKIKDSSTKEINKQFLLKEIQEKQSKRAGLVKQKETFAKEIYGIQEASKPIEENSNYFKDGGSFKGGNFEALCKKHGVTPEEGARMIQKMKCGGRPVLEDGGCGCADNKFADGGGWKLTNSLYNNSGDFTQQPKTKEGTYGKVSDEELSARMKEISSTHPEEYKQYLEGNKYTDPNNVKAYQEAINLKYDKYLEEAKGMYGEGSQEYLTLKGDIDKERFKDDGARKVDSMLGNFTSSRPNYDISKLSSPEDPSEPKPDNSQSEYDPLNFKEYKKTPGALYIPAAVNLPPDSLMPHAKGTFRTPYVDPVAISPDETLREIDRITAASNKVNDMLPIGMRGSANANNLAIMISEASKAITETEKFNATNRQATQQINTNIDNIIEKMRYAEVPRYEEIAYTALDKTKQDFNNYFNTMQSNQLQKYNYITSQKMIDSMFENISVDPFGTPEVDPNTFVPFTPSRNTKG